MQAVVLRDTSFVLAGPITDGTVETIEACSTCAVLDVPEFTSMDVTTRLAELTRTAITRSSGVNWVMAPYDAAASFAVQGIRDSGVTGILAGATGANMPNLGSSATATSRSSRSVSPWSGSRSSPSTS